MPAALDDLARELRGLGVRRIGVLAWRDLDDPEAGGSELHADEVMRRWADAGLDIVHRTSAAAGVPATGSRHGYRVVRRGGRFDVFPRTAAATVARLDGRLDGLVEIWNGVPWLGPLWFRGPRAVWLHHVHGPMWDQVLPGPLAAAGRFLELRAAPPLYRRSQVVTLTDASRDELAELGFPADHVHVVPPGVDPSFGPGGARATAPTVVAVGRLAPVKRLDVLVDAALQARRQVPDLVLEVIGEGPSRPDLERQVAGAKWVRLRGRVSHADLVAAYQRAWLVASASLAEGWGMVITEGAACGTPAVATDTVGHRGAVVDGVTGVVVRGPAQLAGALVDLLTDGERRVNLGAAAREHAATLSWDRTAHDTLAVLVADARRRAAR